MDRLKERLRQAEAALSTLEELVWIKSPSKVERDAAIQRFEYSFEAVWKTAQRFLFVVEGIESGSPKSVFRRSREVGLITSEETVQALQMADDRNLTVHTYNEKLAERICARIPDHSHLLRQLVTAMENRTLEVDED